MTHLKIGGQSPRPTLQPTKESRKKVVFFRSLGGRPTSLKPAIPFILFQQNTELSKKTG
jgi:hypothetical protein